MRTIATAVFGAVLLSFAPVDAARAYQYAFTYDFTGSAFNFSGPNGFQSGPVGVSGTLMAKSDEADPSFISFDTDGFHAFFNQGSYFISADFDALGGQGHVQSQIGTSGALGNFSFGGGIYGSDAGGQPLNGTLSGSFSIAAVSSVPLPATAGLFGGALAALGLAGRRLARRRAATV